MSKAFGRNRTHHSHKSALIKVSGGAIQEVILYGVVGQVFVADIDTLAGLTPEEREAKILLGYPTRIVDHVEFERTLEELINPPAPEPTPEAPAVPVATSTDTPPSIEPTLTADEPASPVSPTATEPTVVAIAPSVS